MDGPVHVLVGPGQEAGPAGPAGRSLGVVGGEPHPISRQAIQMGGGHRLVAGCPQTVTTPLVQGHQ